MLLSLFFINSKLLYWPCDIFIFSIDRTNYCLNWGWELGCGNASCLKQVGKLQEDFDEFCFYKCLLVRNINIVLSLCQWLSNPVLIIWLSDHADLNDGKLLKGMDLKEKSLKERNTLQELEPAAVQVLHELVSLVHNSVNANQDGQSLSTSTNGYELVVNDKFEKIVNADFKDDPVAKFLWDINPQTLQDVFLAMVVSLY